MMRSIAVLLCLFICVQLPAKTQHKKGGRKTGKGTKSSGKGSEKATASQLKFKDGDVYDFGKIPMGKDVSHEFTFFNTGNQPLIIKNVRSPYGTTTPEWTRHPVTPGGKGMITVGYLANKKGPFSREINIESNASAAAQKDHKIRIKGTVD